MKTLDWKSICPTVFVIALAAVLATAYVGGERITVLSDTSLASFWGGYKWCAADSHSKCREDVDCEDVSCSNCKQLTKNVSTLETGNWCSGILGNRVNVTACYRDPEESESCSYVGPEYLTNCKVDVYHDIGCKSKKSDDQSVATKDCT
jgi:hypothetical protein